MGKSIDAVLEVQQRDKIMMQLSSIARAVKDTECAMDKKFVPLEESAFDHVLGLLDTAMLCVNTAAKEFGQWLADDDEEAVLIPEYKP